MPRGPRGEHRPADVIARAVAVARIATGEEQESLPQVVEKCVAVALVRKRELRS